MSKISRRDALSKAGASAIGLAMLNVPTGTTKAEREVTASSIDGGRKRKLKNIAMSTEGFNNLYQSVVSDIVEISNKRISEKEVKVVETRAHELEIDDEE